jgi:hypothetical protein
MARLPKGAESSISMGFLVMCADKILRLLRLFFVTIYTWFFTWQRPGWLWVALRTSYLLEIAESAGHCITGFSSCLPPWSLAELEPARDLFFRTP